MCAWCCERAYWQVANVGALMVRRGEAVIVNRRLEEVGHNAMAAVRVI